MGFIFILLIFHFFFLFLIYTVFLTSVYLKGAELGIDISLNLSPIYLILKGSLYGSSRKILKKNIIFF
jgi:hypothetical protein